MSQRSEKYARSMERRVAKLEGRVDQINMDVIRHGVRLSTAEELAKVMAMPVSVQDADYKVYEKRLPPGSVVEIEDRRTERANRRKRVARRRRLLLAAVVAVIAVLCLVIATRGEAADTERQPVTTEDATVVSIIRAVEEELPEPEKTEEVLLAQGYLSDTVPLPYDLQDAMRTECASWGCPYPLALAVAEVESRFDMDAVGAVGEVGIMQLNPGPGGAYHAELEEATGQDPTTPAGNVACGTYLLGKYMEKYEDPEKAAMAYNMGEGGARKAWAAGVTSTKYSAAVLAAMEVWECTVNAWNGV